MARYGYTVKNSIEMIDEFCENPEMYNSSLFQGAINDARSHYESGLKSWDWYKSVERILSQYIK